MTWKDFQGKAPIWCQGCGDFGVLRAMQTAMTESGHTPNDTVLVTGIGCSGTVNNNFQSFGFHGVHGRALPVATGIKLANPDLNVLVAGGDGDGFGIGLGHFLHAARRNVDLTYVVMDNHIYGLTKGQTSPTTGAGMATKASPLGPMADPVRPLELAMAGGATYVAQGFSGDPKGLVALLRGAVEHRGFSLVLVQSPCVTYNALNTYDWVKENALDLTKGHDPTDRDAANAIARRTDVVPLGLVYQARRPVFADGATRLPVDAAADPAGSLAQHRERFTAWGEAFRVR